MRCYYRNGISCGANRREFEDQSVIKRKIKINGIRPSWSLILGHWRASTRRKQKSRKRGRRRRRRGFQIWISMVLYGFVNICMDLYGMDSWILDPVLCLGFSYEKF